MESIKDQAHRMIDNLPDTASWDDAIYALYVLKKIEAGMEDSKAGRVTPHEEVKRKFLTR